MDSDNGVEGQRIASSMSDHVQLLLDLNQKNLDGQMDGTPMSGASGGHPETSTGSRGKG